MTLPGSISIDDKLKQLFDPSRMAILAPLLPVPILALPSNFIQRYRFVPTVFPKEPPENPGARTLRRSAR
jgi:hypothetical protein